MKTCPKCGKCNLIYTQNFLVCRICGYSWPNITDDEIIKRCWYKMSKVLSQEQIDARLSGTHTATNTSYYSRWKIEPLDFIAANNLDFLRGNIIKYIMRYDAKGGLEDLKKARNYLDRLIKKAEQEK